MADDAGLLSIDEPLLAFVPTYATPSVRANVAGMTPRHLLTMSSGIREDLWTELRERPSEDWVRRVLETPLVDAPGTRFRYSSLNSHMLAAALANRTGLSPREFLTPRLFEPLGMVPPPWDTDGRGISEGGRGMWLRTEELAALGQFYLNDGVWGGRRLLSGAWIQQATSARIATASPDVDWAQGYGFQFWRGTGGTFRADGAYGQFSVVDRARDAVVAVTAHSERTAVILGAIHAFLQHHDPGHHDPGHHAGPQHIELQHDK
jgi:CubicO group peptidase (beta-lactamase class C family)